MKPNILFLLTDDQRYNTINALGNKQISTPNLDKLVKNGTAFINAHIPGGTSGAVCMPSRAMLNTGRTLFNIYKQGQEIDNSHKTIGETLTSNGYETFGIGKWHNGTESFNRSFSNGENIFFGGMWDHWNVPVCDFLKSGNYDSYKNFSTNAFNSNQVFSMLCDKVNTGVHSTELFSNSAISFIKRNKEENNANPFYMYVSYLAPHDPRTMPKKWQEMYNPDDIELPENFLENHPFDIMLDGMRDEVLASFPRNEKEIKRHLADYYAMISHLDYNIGEIINTLKETGQYENTIIVFCADNGLAVGSHGLMGKQNLYEHSIRVPLIFSGPSIPQGQVVDNYVYLLDIFPTLLEMLNIEIPQSVEGKSFYKMFSDKELVTRENLYFAYTGVSRAVKNKRYKYIKYNDKIGKTQLFDLLVDPLEIKDLYNDMGYDQVKIDMENIFNSLKDEWEFKNKANLNEFSKEFFNIKEGGE